jgi:TolB-like protein/DNA-binding SARP family transcriptional activator/Tfp pilus assembly protein PilF
MGLRIRLLGPVTIEVDGRPVAVASKKARALLGYLALREGTEVSRGVLTGLLWGERSESQARGSLRQTLSELRAALAGSASQSIMASKETVAWVAGSAWIDAKVVETAASGADHDALRDAAEFTGGELMEGLSVGEAGFEQWLAAERERFRLLSGRIHARLMERAEHDGRLEEALTHGLKLISCDPLQEHIHRALMRLYAAQGRHDAALAQYERCRRELSNQLGVGPEAETEELARSIRATRREGPAKPRASPSLTPEPEHGRWPALSLPDKPSIAVLPFVNLSGDPEQEYFADGMVEDIITALSRMRWLFVIARASSFTYKGHSVDVKQVARELGVRYVLEGSVRKAASRVRIAGQLIDGSTGAHLWADRFEGALEDVFDLQDRMTASVVGAIAPRLEQAEIERAKRKPTESMDAYDHYLRGMASFYQRTREGTSEALQMYYRAIELDPGFASAYGVAAFCYCMRKAYSWMTDREQEIAETARLARRAVALGRDDAGALSAGGIALAYVVGDLDNGAAFIDQALALNPNLAAAWIDSGWARLWLGEPDLAIEHLARAMRLSPLYPQIGRMQFATAHAHFFAGRYDMASSWAEMALRASPDAHQALRIAAASHALAGHLEQAQKALARLRQLHPALRVSNLRDTQGPHRRPEDLARFEEGLRMAGLPE